MKKCDMPYALSVFLPESGITQEILSKRELIDVMSLKSDDYLKSRGDSTPLLLDIVQKIHSAGSLSEGQVTSCT